MARESLKRRLATVKVTEMGATGTCTARLASGSSVKSIQVEAAQLATKSQHIRYS